VVYQLDDKQSLKLILSEGFNSPTLAQNRVIGVDGNPTVSDIHAETIQSTDFAYTYSDEQQHFVANVFYLEAKDLIERKTGGGFTNATTTVQRHGIELDYKYAQRQWQVFANGHYLAQGNKTVEGDSAAFVVPKITAALGASYQFNHHQLGLSLRYIGKRAELDAYNIVNVSYSWSTKPLRIFVDLLNVLDDTALQHNSALLQFPMQMASAEGASARIGFSYQFN